MHRFSARAEFLLAALTLGVALSVPGAGEALARGRLVGCHIESSGAAPVSGKCRFTPGAGGSFTLQNANSRKPVVGDEILMISVWIVSPGVAEVSGLTRQGVNSRWGEARRAGNASACWVGSDFKICAH